MNNLINKQILEKLAVLAKIEIKKENKEKLLADLGEILNHFQELQNVNIGDIEPLNGGTNLINISRNDENKDVNKEISNDDLIGQFQENKNGFLKIPPVFE